MSDASPPHLDDWSTFQADLARRLRDAPSGEALARRLPYSKTKINRLKSGRQRPDRDELKQLLEVAGKAPAVEIETWVERWELLMQTPQPIVVDQTEVADQTAGRPPQAPSRRRPAAGVIVAICPTQAVRASVALILRVSPRRDLAGHVRCTSGANVSGVWVFEPGLPEVGDFAQPVRPGPDGSPVFEARVLDRPAYQFHVGCGGSRIEWKVKGYSDTISADTPVNLVCDDTRISASPPYTATCTNQP